MALYKDDDDNDYYCYLWCCRYCGMANTFSCQSLVCVLWVRSLTMVSVCGCSGQLSVTTWMLHGLAAGLLPVCLYSWTSSVSWRVVWWCSLAFVLELHAAFSLLLLRYRYATMHA